MINLVFSAWVGFAAWRGYRAGWISVLLGLLALVLAYLVCFLGTATLAGAFQSKGMNTFYAFVLAALLLFAGTGFLVAQVPRWLLKQSGLLRRSRQSSAGALLGAVSGIVSGLLLLWVFALLKAALALPMQSSVVEAQAKQIVGKVANLGVEVAGVEGLKAAATRALFREPDTFVTSLRALAESPELKDFYSDPAIQARLWQNDIDEIVEHPRFVALTEHQGAQVFLEDAGRGGRRELAGNLAMVWRRMQLLQNDPEVREILQDEEVKKLLAEGNPVNVMGNKKIQLLVERVMDSEFSDADYQALAVLSSNADNEPQAQGSTEIYQWRDDEGNIQFSDWESIPLDKRSQAVLISGAKSEER